MKKHLNLKSDIEGKVSTGVLLSGFSAIFLASILSSAAFQLGMSPLESVGERVLPTYIASIIPGASTGDNLQHYCPENIAIPVGITVAWSNNDPGSRTL